MTGLIRTGWHCEHASDGCINCYAEQINKGFFQLGTKQAYTRPARDKVEIFLDEETLLQPLRWRKPRFIFPCSMTDWMGAWVPDEWIDKMLAVAALCPQHTFLFLTKRAERLSVYFGGDQEARQDAIGEQAYHLTGTLLSGAEDCSDDFTYLHWPLPNVWLGVSCEDQKTADERIPLLLQTPAAIRWISAEPLLESVSFRQWIWPTRSDEFDKSNCWFMSPDGWHHRINERPGGIVSISWVVVGGESGPHARPFDLQWARGIIYQCAAAGVACFVKQLGAQPFDGYLSAVEVVGGGKGRPRPADQPLTEAVALEAMGSFGPINRPVHLRDKKGGDILEWPADLRVRQFPEVANVNR